MSDLIYLAFCEPLKSCFSVTDFCHPRFAGRSGLWRCMILDRYTTKLEWKLNCTSITETYLRFSYSKWKALSAWQHHYKELCIGYCSLALHKKKAFLKQPWPKYWLKVFVSGIAILMHSWLWIQLYHHLVFLFQGWEHNTWKRHLQKQWCLLKCIGNIPVFQVPQLVRTKKNFNVIHRSPSLFQGSNHIQFCCASSYPSLLIVSSFFVHVDALLALTLAFPKCNRTVTPAGWLLS